MLAAASTVLDAAASAQAPAPVAAAGCEAPVPTPGTSTLHFAAAGKTGSYIREVPPGADRPLPLVLNLHGYLEPAVIAHVGTGLGEFGYSHGFLTITPQLDEAGFPRWDFGEGSADVGYLSELITHVESTVCVDPLRIYVAGLSMGAFTTSSMACQLSHRVAAIAAVSGLRDFAWCNPTRRVPVVAFHGTADPIVAYTGGAGPNVRLLPSRDGSGSAGQQRQDGSARNGPGLQSISDNAAAWARRNGCESEPTQQQLTSDVTVYNYSCPADASVQLYSIIGGGHLWPGTTSSLYPAPLVGANTTSISANQIIWDFFLAHPLRS
ncbi:alpha/beta hydrolase family esterase [Nocardia abscessus]|uniref:alpha/beta hydrolase family esterase n=1 Tax=Nocardia abscessus TaxID=120957 RepID=UPI0024558FB7|nr:PHB depolymerase family esterase [Nocardia abscessus]